MRIALVFVLFCTILAGAVGAAGDDDKVMYRYRSRGGAGAAGSEPEVAAVDSPAPSAEPVGIQVRVELRHCPAHTLRFESLDGRPIPLSSQCLVQVRPRSMRDYAVPILKSTHMVRFAPQDPKRTQKVDVVYDLSLLGKAEVVVIKAADRFAKDTQCRIHVFGARPIAENDLSGSQAKYWKIVYDK